MIDNYRNFLSNIPNWPDLDPPFGKLSLGIAISALVIIPVGSVAIGVKIFRSALNSKPTTLKSTAWKCSKIVTAFILIAIPVLSIACLLSMRNHTDFPVYTCGALHTLIEIVKSCLGSITGIEY